MKKTTFLIVGKHAVLEAIKNPSRKIERVFLTEDAQKKLNRENQSLNLFPLTVLLQPLNLDEQFHLVHIDYPILF